MDEENKQNELVEKETTSTSEEVIEPTDSNILKPTTSTKEIMDRQKRNNNKQIAMKIERYNYKNGFQNPPPSTNSIKIENTKDNSYEYRIEIKSPGDKKTLIILVSIVIVIIIGSFLVTKLLNKNTKPIMKSPEEAEVTKELEKKEKKETTCTMVQDYGMFGYNYILENKIYSIDDKLKSYTKITKYDYTNEVPDNITSTCNNINDYYKEYKGYEYKCNRVGQTITYEINVDLELLKEKELSFTIKDKIDNKIIEENLDDDVNEYLNKFKEEGYICESTNRSGE